MNQITTLFNETFAPWSIILPQGAVEERQRGVLAEAGWTIHYLFGANNRGEYLDYYATHRMTNDRHIRIYANGSVDVLEAPQDFMIYPAGCSKENKEEIEKQYFENNRRIYADLAKKGFV